MLRTYQYRFYPTTEQASALNQILDLAQWLYNHALAYRRKRWHESRHTVTYADQAAMWRDWRNEQPEDNPLRMLNMTAGQQVLRRLDNSYREFLKGKRGKPRFRKRRAFNTINFKPGDGAAIKDSRLYLQNVGRMAVKWHRPLLDGDLKNIVITRKASGWYVAFQVECPDVEIAPSLNPPVGIDIGIYHALALSDGTVIDSPQYLKQALQRLRLLHRRVARRQKGSKRRQQAVQQLAKMLEHIANQRRDWWHKVTTWLVSVYGTIVLEELNLTFMLCSGNLSRAAHDVALGLFGDLLDYKAVQAGVQMVKVNPRNTSQVCSACGCMVKKTLNIRVHSCPHCGFTVDRDVNAALNILGLGWDASVKRQRSGLPQA